jgi:hypothetical protein
MSESGPRESCQRKGESAVEIRFKDDMTPMVRVGVTLRLFSQLKTGPYLSTVSQLWLGIHPCSQAV